MKEYISLKICIQTDDAESSPVLNEIKMLRCLNEFAKVDHPGLDFTRLARDIFETDSNLFSGHRHYCIAFKPQGNSVRTLQETFPNAMLPKLLVRSVIHHLFFSVNWLHATCGAAHTGKLLDVCLSQHVKGESTCILTMDHLTDISPQNVLMQIENDTSLKDVEDQESQNPSIPAIMGDTVIYKSQPTILELSGHPILTDFGQMRLVKGCTNQDWWMPDLYRAPEVLLQLPWGFPVDIWSIGVMVSLKVAQNEKFTKPLKYRRSNFWRAKTFSIQ